MYPNAKTCGSCGQAFGCGSGGAEPCWCADLPPVLPVGVGDCLCPKCLRREITMRVGVCGTCAHAQARRTKGGSAVFQCALSAADPAYSKYPRLPKGSCAGYEERATKA